MVRKIYQSATDVPQAMSNKAIEMIERHFAASGVRRAEELPEENKVRLFRELQRFFQSELPNGKDAQAPAWDAYRREGLIAYLVHLVGQTFGLRSRQ